MKPDELPSPRLVPPHEFNVRYNAGRVPGTLNDGGLGGRTRVHGARRPVDLYVPKGDHTCTRAEYYEHHEER